MSSTTSFPSEAWPTGKMKLEQAPNALSPRLQALNLTDQIDDPFSIPTAITANHGSESQEEKQHGIEQPIEDLKTLPNENTPGIFDPPSDYAAEAWRKHVEDALSRTVQNPREKIFDDLIANVMAEWMEKTGNSNVAPWHITQDDADAEDIVDDEMMEQAEMSSGMEAEDTVAEVVKMEEA